MVIDRMRIENEIYIFLEIIGGGGRRGDLEGYGIRRRHAIV